MQEVSSNTFIPPHPLKTAVLFLVFNRPDTTKRVFEVIRKAKPPRLYIAADGPRVEKAGEAEKCEQVRRIATQVDWECEVKTLFRDKNLGCGKAVSSAIDWFFENEEEGIILEDDCLPSQSFFWFCEELLQKYKDDTRIGMIAGTSYLFNEISSEEDYFYSKYTAIWGWATWKRIWKKYDVNINSWPSIKEENILENIFYWDKKLVEFYTNYYDRIYNNEIDTWDAQWGYVCRLESSYCVTSYKNLISNIGYVGTRSSDSSPFINMNKIELNMTNKLRAPKYMIHNLRIDKILFYNVFSRFKKYGKIKYILKKLKLFNILKGLLDIAKNDK